jgi:hypothetical protein
MHRSRLTISSTPGGMTKMEIRNIFGPEATQASTLASVVSTIIASKFT